MLACFIPSHQDDAHPRIHPRSQPSQPSQLPHLCQTLSGDGIDLELGSGGGALSRPRAWASRSIFKRKSGSKPFSSNQRRLGTSVFRRQNHCVIFDGGAKAVMFNHLWEGFTGTFRGQGGRGRAGVGHALSCNLFRKSIIYELFSPRMYLKNV